MARDDCRTFLCTALVVIAFVFMGWATPDTINAVKGLYADASKQDEVNQKLLSNIRTLTERINALENNRNGISNVQKTLQQQEFDSMSDLFTNKATVRFDTAPDTYKREAISSEQLKRLIAPDRIRK